MHKEEINQLIHLSETDSSKKFITNGNNNNLEIQNYDLKILLILIIFIKVILYMLEIIYIY